MTISTHMSSIESLLSMWIMSSPHNVERWLSGSSVLAFTDSIASRVSKQVTIVCDDLSTPGWLPRTRSQQTNCDLPSLLTLPCLTNLGCRRAARRKARQTDHSRPHPSVPQRLRGSHPQTSFPESPFVPAPYCTHLKAGRIRSSRARLGDFSTL